MIEVIIGVVKLLVLVAVLSVYVMYATWYERKVIGHMQQRIGPKRVGPYGLLQPLADTIKSFFKEDIIPTRADKPLFWLAPILAPTFPFAAAAAIPFFPPIELSNGTTFYFSVFHSNVDLLYILAMMGLSSFGVMLAGIASGGNKYSFLGAQREIAQVVSYEIILALALLNPILMVQSLNLTDFVTFQQQHLWLVFYQPFAFVAFVIAMVASASRVPFDLPEAENELVAGFNTEFSGLKMAMFFFGQYVTIFVVSALAAIIFLGGWSGPAILPGFIWYWLKVVLFIFMFTWFWGTFPRYRYDQLMDIAWKKLLPLLVLNILWTGFALIVHMPII
jgi:NADH-quinone oxidoreductase subunit H